LQVLIRSISSRVISSSVVVELGSASTFVIAKALTERSIPTARGGGWR